MIDEIIGNWIVDFKSRPAFYLDRRSTNAHRIFSHLDVDLVDHPRQANLVWLRRGFEKIRPLLRRGQLVNHFARESAMINKGHLTHNLNAQATSDFYPESYRLYDAGERESFFGRLPGPGDAEQIWIMKPANLSRGIGIRILREFDALRRQFIDEDLSDPVLDPGIDYIAQRYITDPLLLDGRKSELRVYWMIASLDPLRVLMFDEGTVRLTTDRYSLEDLDNPLVHVTNTYQQKRHASTEQDITLKWTFDKLGHYLSDELGVAPAGFLQTSLKSSLHDCLRQVVCAVVDELRDTLTEATCFGVYGADIILDGTLKPWLTEIQKNPGLSHDDPVKINLVPEMLREAVQIALATETDDWQDLPRRFEWVIGPGD